MPPRAPRAPGRRRGGSAATNAPDLLRSPCRVTTSKSYCSCSHAGGEPMILIVGSTGYLGSLVTTKLATAGKPVTALVRDAASEKARALKQAGAKLVTGDLKDRASLEKALEGVDT